VPCAIAESRDLCVGEKQHDDGAVCVCVCVCVRARAVVVVVVVVVVVCVREGGRGGRGADRFTAEPNGVKRLRECERAQPLWATGDRVLRGAEWFSRLETRSTAEQRACVCACVRA
jgi:hypothetical protein